jgi:prepilin-type N-terminal cleavage/methylation domain-containing protein
MARKENITGVRAETYITALPCNNSRGFTLIELVVVIMIAAILAAVAVKKIAPVLDTVKVEETKQEMNRLAIAITGNPELRNNGVRTDFGYVGDIGAMPPDLDALVSNPGSYATWKGPYVNNSFEQITGDYKKDAWQSEYLYTGGTTVTSTGSGNNIIRRLTSSVDELLHNRIMGTVYDKDGIPPGNDYKDSLVIRLTFPDGSGGTTTKSSFPDIGGSFGFDSIPIGNHSIEIVYLPDHDTLRRFISVVPGSNLYGEHFLLSSLWSGGAGYETHLTKVAGSDSLYADCHGFFFWIENNTGSPVDVSSVTLTWTSPTAYYRYVKWNGTTVFNRNFPKAASGETVYFTGTQTINNGETLRVDFDFFRNRPIWGWNIDMDNVTFQVDFSDGSTMTVITGACP